MSTPPPFPGVPPASPAPAKQGTAKGCWLAGCGGCAVAVVAVAVALVVLVKLGVAAWEEQVRASLRDNPVVLEQLGRLDRAELDWRQSLGVPGDSGFAFRLHGTKASGLAELQMSGDDEMVPISGVLRLDDGSSFDLFAAAGEEPAAAGPEAADGVASDPASGGAGEGDGSP